MTCNRIETGSCHGCTVPAILWEKALTKEAVEIVAKRISKEYCPEGSGGIDQATRGIVYNHKPAEKPAGDTSIW